MALQTHTSDSVYLTKDNIQHPGTAAQATASAAQARLDITARLNLTSVSGGTVKQGR